MFHLVLATMGIAPGAYEIVDIAEIIIEETEGNVITEEDNIQ